MRVDTHVPRTLETACPIWNQGELASERSLREDVSYSVGHEFRLHRQAIECIWDCVARLEERVKKLEADGWTDEDLKALGVAAITPPRFSDVIGNG